MKRVIFFGNGLAGGSGMGEARFGGHDCVRYQRHNCGRGHSGKQLRLAAWQLDGD